MSDCALDIGLFISYDLEMILLSMDFMRQDMCVLEGR